MSEPVRLLSDPEATPFERSLLASWSGEQPKAEARDRLLGLAGAAAAAAVGAAVAPKVASAGLSVAAKWMLLGVMLLGAGAAALTLARRSSTEPARDAQNPVAAVAPSPSPVLATPPQDDPGAARAAPSAAAIPAISPDDLPSAGGEHGPVSGRTAPQAPSAGATRDASLAEEIAMFDRARTALDAGDADRALTLLDAYESRFRRGAFVQEAEVLRVQALARKGDSAGAARVGQRFLATHPTSPHAARIRAILGTSER